MSQALLAQVMVTDADYHVFECLRCGAEPFAPCTAIEGSPHPVGTPLKGVHDARRTGRLPAPRREPKPLPEFGDADDLPDVLDFGGADSELVSCRGADGVEAGTPLHLTPEQVERFWSKVRKGGLSHPTRPELGNCWWWSGPRAGRGKFRYGTTTVNGRTWRAHRLAYALTYGEPKLHVLHTCDRPGCVRPNHLYEGTPRNNSHDSLRRGRAKKFRTDNPTGFRGVQKMKRGYQARITVGGRSIYLGTYATAEEAARSYDKAAFKYHGALYCASYPTFNFPEEWQ